MPTPPISTTNNLELGQFAQGAHPGATALNDNWAKIDVLANGSVFPEQHGAVGDGVTNDAAALSTAIAAAAGKTLILSKAVYKITSKIEVDLAGADIEISSRFGSKILLTNITSNSTYQVPEGNIMISNAGNVILSNIKIEGVNESSGSPILPQLAQGDGLSSLANIVIQDCDNVLVDGCTITKGVYAGIRTVDCKRVTFRDNDIEYNTYAGAHITRCGQVVATGNSFSYNGDLTKSLTPYGGDYWGYGITCSHRYGQPVDNTGVYIAGNKCWYNTRKSIDCHDVVGGIITGNDCLGGTLGFTNEAGSDPDDPSAIDPNWAKRVKDIIISNNYIHNDLTWFNSCTHLAPFQWLTIGSFSNTAFGAGNIIVTDNIFRDCNMPNSRGLIWCAINIAGTPIEVVKITNNVFYDVLLAETKYGFPEEYDGVIYLVNGTVAPKFVDISGNVMYGKSINGIKAGFYNTNQAQRTVVNFNNNQFQGTFRYPLYVDRDVQRIISNNYYNGKRLPDYDNHFNGTLKAQLNTGEVSFEFTVDTTNDIINAATPQSIEHDMELQFSSSGSLPSPLTAGTTYYVLRNEFDFVTFTADASNNILTLFEAKDIYEGMGVRFTTSGTLPSPLAINTDYYVKYISSTQLKLASSIGGSEIDITSAGTGNHRLHVSLKTFKIATEQRDEPVNLTDTGSGTHTAYKNSKDLLSQDANNYVDGTVLYEINILAAGASPKFGALFQCVAWARNDDGTVNFGTELKFDRWIYGTQDDSYLPQLNWIGSGDIRTLRVTCPTTYTNYNIEVKMSSWRIHLLRTE
jgi:hypothetical protein